MSGRRGHRCPLPSTSPVETVDVDVCPGDPWRQEETDGGSQTMGDGQDRPRSLHSYPRQGLMEKPNQVTGQRAQEEVRGQGSEVVHFIDQVLPTSCNTLQSQTLSFATMPPTD